MRHAASFGPGMTALVLGLALAALPGGLLGGDLLPPCEAIRPGRPRLLLRPADTPRAISLQQLKAIPRDESFQKMLAQIEGLKGSPSAQALAWHLTGQDEPAQRAAAAMKNWQLQPNRAGDPFYVYFTLVDLALGYDWLHGYAGFDEAARTALRQKVRPLLEAGVKSGNDHVFHNYVWMFNGGTMLWAMATAGEDPASDKAYAVLRDRFNKQLYGAMAYLAGGNGDSAGYWWLYCHNAAVLVLLAGQSATGQDLLAATEAPDQARWLARQYDYLLLSILPDLRFMPWGDIVAGPNGGVTHEMADKIDMLAWALKSPAGGQVSRWLEGRRGKDRYYGETVIFYFLYGRHLPGQKADPPLSVLAGDRRGGQAIFRSDWSEQATIVGFRCADFFGQHNHLDQGSFILYRNGLLALDAGKYQRVAGPQMATDAHNTLLLGGAGQRRQTYQSAATLDAFTQRLAKGLETGDILSFKDAGAWAAVSGQFAQAYEPALVQSCVRQLLFVRPGKGGAGAEGGAARGGIVVVVDRLAAPAGASLPEVKWLLHVPAAPAAPTVEGPCITASNGRSTLRCRALPAPGASSDAPDAAGPKPSIEPGLPTPAGPSSSGGSPKVIDVSRIVYTYPGKPAMTLVHVLDVCDGAPGAAPPARVEPGADGSLRVTVAGAAYTFEAGKDFAVTAQALDAK